MRIVLASDHGGFEIKEVIRHYLEGQTQYPVTHIEDFGPKEEMKIDYPLMGKAVAAEVAEGNFDLGILVCGTGIGMSIVANKVKGIRAAHITTKFEAQMAREHNNANIICLAGRNVKKKEQIYLVQTFLKAEFAGGHHQERLNLISLLEEDKLK